MKKQENATQVELVSSIMQNYPEAGRGCALQCTHWKYDALEFEFLDEETDKFYKVIKSDLLLALELCLSEKVWPKGCTQFPRHLTEGTADDWLCQSDATDHDAFVQIAIFGEVIYG